MKTLILDKSKWVCGDTNRPVNVNGEICSLGKGRSELLNEKGFMCCLGQFAQQLNPGISMKGLLGQDSPEHIYKETNCGYNPIPIEGLSKMQGYSKKDKELVDTTLSLKAMIINDDAGTTIETKIKKLRALFLKKGFKIKVIESKKETTSKLRKANEAKI